MNRLTITNNDKSVVFEDLDIKFPDDIKLGSYSITVPSTPELSKVLTSGSLDATLTSSFDRIWGPIRGKVVITSKTPDAINFNFIRTDYGGWRGIYYNGKMYEYVVPDLGSGLSSFPDTKVSTIGTYKAIDFTMYCSGQLDWGNIYGLKTSPREEPIEMLTTDHTPVWGDVDPVTACNPFGNACVENYSFRYSGEYNSQRFGGQNRLMTLRLSKFTCLETGFYDLSLGHTSFSATSHASDYIEGSKVLNINGTMWTTPSIDFALIEDDKFDDLKDDFILYPKQESYISVKQMDDPTMKGEVYAFFQEILGNSPTYPTDRNYIGAPSGYTVGVESDLFSVGDITYGKNVYTAPADINKYPSLTNKDGVVVAHRVASSKYYEDSPLEKWGYGIFPSDVRGMMCMGVKDRRLKLMPVYDGSLGYTRSSNAPYADWVGSSTVRAETYFGNKVATVGYSALDSRGLMIDSMSSLYSTGAGEIVVGVKTNDSVIDSIFLEAGKTYSFVVQVGSCPVMVMHNGQKELRYMFPEKFSTDFNSLTHMLTISRAIRDAESFISPSPHDIGVGKLSELPVVDVLDGSFWGYPPNTPFVNTMSLNPKGDYYDFARGSRGLINNGVGIRQYNKLLLDKLLLADFKVTISTSIGEFSLGIRDVDGLYKDILISDFTQDYDGVDYISLYSGGFESIDSDSLDLSTPMISNIVKSKMEFAVRNTTEDEEDDNTIDNAFEDTHTLRFSRNATPQYYYDFLSLNHDTAKEINNYIEVTDFPCQFQTESGVWITTCSSNIVDVLNIDTIKETCTVRFYLPTAGYLL